MVCGYSQEGGESQFKTCHEMHLISSNSTVSNYCCLGICFIPYLKILYSHDSYIMSCTMIITDINLQNLCLAKLSSWLKSDSDVDALSLPPKLKLKLKDRMCKFYPTYIQASFSKQKCAMVGDQASP